MKFPKALRVFALSLGILLSLTMVTVGCGGQVPPSPAPTVDLTWTAPSNATPSFVYVVSRCTVTSGTTCSNYTPLNQSAPVATTKFTDATPPTGVNVLYIVQAVNAGITGNPSGPSNLLAVPTFPGVPGAPNATQNAMLAPPKVDGHEEPTVAFLDSLKHTDLHLVARIHNSR